MKVIIATEAGGGIGSGHLSRSAGLGRGFEERGLEPEIILNSTGQRADEFSDGRIENFDWLSRKDLFLERIDNTDIVIVDSYLADAQLCRRIADKAGTAVFFDDYNRIEYPDGVIINGSIAAEAIGYRNDNGRQYLLGKDYAPLRRAFWDVKQKVIKDDINDVLITFGGNVNCGFVEKLLAFLASVYPAMRYHVVSAAGNIAAVGGVRVSFYSALDDEGMCGLMSDCDVCLCGGGQTTYELARLGSVIVAVCFADNQTLNLDSWKASGFIDDWCRFDDRNVFEKIGKAIEKLGRVSLRQKRSDIGRALVDGQGVRRIVDFLLNDRAGN